MLSEMSREQFNQWWAAAVLEGWDSDDQWRLAGVVAAEVRLAGLLTANAMGAKLSEKHAKTPDDFIPHRQTTEKSEPVLSSDQAEQIMAERWG